MRSSSATAYYTPNKDKENLKLLTGAQAARIVFEEKDGELVATGVEYYKDGELQTIKANKEVIVATGMLLNSSLSSYLCLPRLVQDPTAS